MNWLADSLHCVVFSQPTMAVPDALQPWLRLFGSAPQSYQQNLQGAVFGSMSSGTIGQYQISIAAQPGRMELAILPIPYPAPDASLPVIRDIATAFAVLQGYSDTLLETGGAIRVALILNLSGQTADAETAKEKFKQSIHYENLPTGATDLSFALNIRTPISLPTHTATGLEMNRVCRWGTSMHQLVQVQVGVGGPAPTVVKETHVVTLQLDLNTIPRQVPFLIDEARAVFAALVAEARHLISEGYDRLACPC